MIGFIEKVGRAIEAAAEDFDFGDDDLIHIICDCDPNRSLCGKDTTDREDMGPAHVILPDDCLVCLDLNGLACPRCGQK